jgi:hypothetical protein
MVDGKKEETYPWRLAGRGGGGRARLSARPTRNSGHRARHVMPRYGLIGPTNAHDSLPCRLEEGVVRSPRPKRLTEYCTMLRRWDEVVLEEFSIHIHDENTLAAVARRTHAAQLPTRRQPTYARVSKPVVVGCVKPHQDIIIRLLQRDAVFFQACALESRWSCVKYCSSFKCVCKYWVSGRLGGTSEWLEKQEKHLPLDLVNHAVPTPVRRYVSLAVRARAQRGSGIPDGAQQRNFLGSLNKDRLFASMSLYREVYWTCPP